MAAQGRGADRLDGQRRRAGRALRPAPAAVQLLQAALRAGDQPADRPDPRVDRHVAGHRRRRRAQPARRVARSTPTSWSWTSRSCATRSSRRCATSPTTSSRAHTIDITWPVADGPGGMVRALAEVCDAASAAIAAGVNVLILSDRASRPGRAPIPSLLAVAAVHHHLVREGTRLRAGLVLESGEPREVHHFATLIGYGASAVNPYLLLRHGRRARRRRPRGRRRGPRRGRAQRRQGDRQGPAQDDLQDGDLDDPVLLRRADLRGGRARAQADRPPLHRHRVADRRHRPRGARRGGARPPRAARTRAPRPRTCCPSAASTPGAATASSTCGTPRRSRCSSTRARGRRRRAGRSTASTPSMVDEEAVKACTLRGLLKVRTDGATPIPLDEVEPAAGDRQALRHRRDVARLDLHRGARDARDRHEPPRRPLEHRRGRGGPAALHRRRQRRPAPLGDQAGRVGPLRRDDPLPGQRRPAADQDGPGRQARRGRPAARPQGRQLHRLGPPHDARASA